ncbi:hypothetical protein FTX61_11075 [Nitriliruptoraceae bacterium ZYF776]|nr:hypothetical protein [Profundirhabdus halotolerans]
MTDAARPSDDVRTVELGQFTDEHAEAIAARLEGARIPWTAKVSGRFTRVFFAGDWGTRVYVDHRRIDEARTLAQQVVDDGAA